MLRDYIYEHIENDSLKAFHEEVGERVRSAYNGIEYIYDGGIYLNGSVIVANPFLSEASRLNFSQSLVTLKFRKTRRVIQLFVNHTNVSETYNVISKCINDLAIIDERYAQILDFINKIKDENVINRFFILKTPSLASITFFKYIPDEKRIVIYFNENLYTTITYQVKTEQQAEALLHLLLNITALDRDCLLKTDDSDIVSVNDIFYRYNESKNKYTSFEIVDNIIKEGYKKYSHYPKDIEFYEYKM